MASYPTFKQTLRAYPWHGVDPSFDPAAGSFDAVIEIPLESSNKYELDKSTGLLRMDRVLRSAVYYPANYGFIPRTLAEDGDSLDFLVLATAAFQPLTIVAVRAIGLMTMLDDDERDDKIIAVPAGDPEYRGYRSIEEMPLHRLAVIKRFFEDYKKGGEQERRRGRLSSRPRGGAGRGAGPRRLRAVEARSRHGRVVQIARPELRIFYDR